MFRALHLKVISNILTPICRDVSDPMTMYDGLCKRLARPLPTINKGVLHRFELFVDAFVKRFLAPLDTQPDFEAWLESTSYNDSRKAQLRLLASRDNFGPPPLKDRKKIKSFGKVEAYPDAKSCRWINSRSDAFKAFCGPWFKAIEDAVFSLPWFIKHVPVKDRPALLERLRNQGAIAWTDFTAFESGFSPAFMTACELRLYKRMLANFPHVSKVILSTIAGQNKLNWRGLITADLKGRRMSGDMCTSLGNGFSNCLMSLFSLAERGEPWDRVDAFFEGDDGIWPFGAVPAGHIRGDCQCRACAPFKQLGFTIKLTIVDDPSDAGFCGLVCTEGRVFRDPVKFLSTFGWTCTQTMCSPRRALQLLRAKALSAIYETPQCPIIAPLAWRALSLTEGHVAHFVEDGYHKVPRDIVNLEKYDPTITMRCFFEAKFNVPVQTQILFERLLSDPSNDLSSFDRFWPFAQANWEMLVHHRITL